MFNNILLSIILSCITYFSFAQQHNYNSSKSIEVVTDSTYLLTYENIDLEKGEFLNNVRNGLWTSKNIKGNIIRKANYKNGLLDGTFELFYFDGKPKVSALFKDGLPTGEWVFKNNKGKVIKKGNYLNGKPINQWEIFDKKGNNVLYGFDFSTMRETTAYKGGRYNTGAWFPQDAQSGEYIQLYPYDQGNIISPIPFGGFELSSDLFNIIFTLPYQLVNTYNTLDLTATIHLENSAIKIIDIEENDKKNSNDSTIGMLHYFASTNRKSKLNNEPISAKTRLFIEEQIKEAIYLSGPWLNNLNDGNFKISIPIVINNLKNF